MNSCPFIYLFQNPENQMYKALMSAKANHGPFRRDQTEEKYSRLPTTREADRESDRLKDATQALIVVSVLIATVAFSATFAAPGGYRADDHTNGGTPTLAGSYVFDAYMVANTLGFTCSTTATIGFAFAAAPMSELRFRKMHFLPSLLAMLSAVTCMTIAFALAMYMVLAPVARNTAIAVCVIAPTVLLQPNMTEFFRYSFLLAKAKEQLLMVVIALLPFVVIFGWAALARILHHH
jgi:hypothetical protein